MTKEQLYTELNYVNHSRTKRLYYANLVINNPELVLPLLDILFNVDNKISCRAAWVIEFMCSENLEHIVPHLDVFTQNMAKVHLDPAVRPVAKVCEYLVIAYYSKTESLIKKTLKPIHKEKIIEACFDWLISDQKVAAKAYSMNSLYYLGTEFNWIHPELKTIIEKDYANQSAAFKAKSRHILERFKKLERKL